MLDELCVKSNLRVHWQQFRLNSADLQWDCRYDNPCLRDDSHGGHSCVILYLIAEWIKFEWHIREKGTVGAITTHPGNALLFVTEICLFSNVYRPHPKDGEGTVFSLFVSSHLHRGRRGVPQPGLDGGQGTPARSGWCGGGELGQVWMVAGVPQPGHDGVAIVLSLYE